MKRQTLPLLGECEGCGASNALLNARTGQHYCAACASKDILYNTQATALKDLLTEVMLAWGYTWSGSFTREELEEIVWEAKGEAFVTFKRQIASDYADDTQEDVQPVPLHGAAD